MKKKRQPIKITNRQFMAFMLAIFFTLNSVNTVKAADVVVPLTVELINFIYTFSGAVGVETKKSYFEDKLANPELQLLIGDPYFDQYVETMMISNDVDPDEINEIGITNQDLYTCMTYEQWVSSEIQGNNALKLVKNELEEEGTMNGSFNNWFYTNFDWDDVKKRYEIRQSKYIPSMNEYVIDTKYGNNIPEIYQHVPDEFKEQFSAVQNGYYRLMIQNYITQAKVQNELEAERTLQRYKLTENLDMSLGYADLNPDIKQWDGKWSTIAFQTINGIYVLRIDANLMMSNFNWRYIALSRVNTFDPSSNIDLRGIAIYQNGDGSLSNLGNNTQMQKEPWRFYSNTGFVSEVYPNITYGEVIDYDFNLGAQFNNSVFGNSLSGGFIGFQTFIDPFKNLGYVDPIIDNEVVQPKKKGIAPLKDAPINPDTGKPPLISPDSEPGLDPGAVIEITPEGVRLPIEDLDPEIAPTKDPLADTLEDIFGTGGGGTKDPKGSRPNLPNLIKLLGLLLIKILILLLKSLQFLKSLLTVEASSSMIHPDILTGVQSMRAIIIPGFNMRFDAFMQWIVVFISSIAIIGIIRRKTDRIKS